MSDLVLANYMHVSVFYVLLGKILAFGALFLPPMVAWETPRMVAQKGGKKRAPCEPIQIKPLLNFV